MLQDPNTGLLMTAAESAPINNFLSEKVGRQQVSTLECQPIEANSTSSRSRTLGGAPSCAGRRRAPTGAP
eukprot:352825-Chlamydomonas_euryale.AAC.9